MRLAIILLSAMMMLLPFYAAADSVPSRGEVLALACVSCHHAAVRPLAGRHDIASYMRAARAEQIAAIIMNRIATGYDDAEIDAIADYFASLSP